MLIVATPVSEDVQTILGCDVRSCVEPSEKVPRAANCWVAPFAMVAVAGVTEINTKAGAVTVKVAVSDMVAKDAVIVVEPCATADARPVPLIVATPGSDELHVTKAVKFCVAPSANVPVAVNCFVVPPAMVAVAGVTARVVTADDVREVEPDMVPKEAVTVTVPGVRASASPFVP